MFKMVSLLCFFPAFVRLLCYIAIWNWTDISHKKIDSIPKTIALPKVWVTQMFWVKRNYIPWTVLITSTDKHTHTHTLRSQISVVNSSFVTYKWKDIHITLISPHFNEISFFSFETQLGTVFNMSFETIVSSWIVGFRWFCLEMKQKPVMVYVGISMNSCDRSTLWRNLVSSLTQ